uniref:Uncharacterized protein n=1 Tax=Candidatus Kentrum sp. FM TaxID=2126340 RepID=A0A450U1W0_9GAMM|nr:MAG: hypothetical protein BECKFM1743C_GA0114222_109341 [Candidatus Kentron sp. FM]VFJ76614.1 MAG: hypothetical protein BECKFM1743A_GA0114220_109351 [Candidatus Kentron sp. FM]VFK23523.1 MAG: hypothetical protein BECKFM1743B_GA0114221_109311 [Candidatus Kentron sp. FM]
MSHVTAVQRTSWTIKTSKLVYSLIEIALEVSRYLLSTRGIRRAPGSVAYPNVREGRLFHPTTGRQFFGLPLPQQKNTSGPMTSTDDIPQPHDRLMKESLSQPERAGALLRER